MDPLVNDVSDSIERELSRAIGYRLLGWGIITLWAVAVVVLFRLLDSYAPAIDQWLLWVAPVLITRSIGSAVVHKQFRAGVNLPSLTALSRMSLLFGVSDGVILLSLAILLYTSGLATALPLLFAFTTCLAVSAFVYMYTPWVAPVLMALVIVPVLVLTLYLGVNLPPELLAACIGVLAITCVGVNRFKSLYLRHLQDKIRYQHEIQLAAESNFIFNEHWQKMHVAAIDWDRDCVIRSWNPAAERLFGITAEEARGESLELLFDRETAADIRSHWIHASEDKYEPPVLRTHPLLNDELTTCWYDTPLFHDGELIGIASFVIDLSERPVIGEGQAGATMREVVRPREAAVSTATVAESSIVAGTPLDKAGSWNPVRMRS